MKKEVRTITYEQAQKIIDSACSTWQVNLAKVWGKNIALKNPSIEISEGDYKAMRAACTHEQYKLFDEIFGKDKEIIDVKVGDLIVVIAGRTSDSKRFDGQCMVVDEIPNDISVCVKNSTSGLHNGTYDSAEFRLANKEEIERYKRSQVWKPGELYWVSDGPNAFGFSLRYASKTYGQFCLAQKKTSRHLVNYKHFKLADDVKLPSIEDCITH